MLKSPSLLVSAVSWEERTPLGIARVCEDRRFSRGLFIRYTEWLDWTRENDELVQALCIQHQIEHIPVLLSYLQPEQSWHRLKELITQNVTVGAEVVIDISTMPREAIWSVCFFVEAAGGKVSYVYHKPERYTDDWLSRDPGRPRLMFQMSGEAQLGLSTVLVVATGFDATRTEQLIRTFEPSQALLAIQSGEQYDNESHNLQAHLHLLKDQSAGTKCEHFWIDAYSPDHGEEALFEHVGKLVGTANILLASLGPKLSAVALYKLNRAHRSMGLVYAPASEYNRDYSRGIGDSVWGAL